MSRREWTSRSHENRRHRGSRRKRAAVFVSLLVVGVLIIGFGTGLFSTLSANASTLASNFLNVMGVEIGDSSEKSINVNSAPGVPDRTIELSSDILVNTEHPIPRGAEIKTMSPVGVVPVKDGSVTVGKTIIEPLRKLFGGASEAGFSDLYITSGLRTYEKQKSLYEKAEDQTYVQKPNCSEHQTGLAVDIASKDGGSLVQPQLKAGRWLAENAWRYGFILRYPEDKEEITGISYEPWHFRYVGKSAAKTCYEKNFCLEEYHEQT
jgi:D-alanyl-D-alanine carboxypeptidase